MMNRNFRRWATALLCLSLAFVALACGKASNNSNAGTDAAASNVKTGVKPEPDAEAAIIETDYGRIVLELYPNLAPQMVARFKKLAASGFYNGTAIHRISPELGIIQGGDPNSKDNNPANDGTGNSGEPNVPAEFSDVLYERGIVGAARTGADINSANCQFFITLKRQESFEQPSNRYTVFGRVIEGINNADIISTAPVTEGTDRPADKILVKSITLAPRANFQKQ
jgi:peptidyl-prolyl cis-trans isomerase B (cyclophilin B)